MAFERTSCVHRGSTFFGDFQMFGDGPESTIQVRYNGRKLEKRAGGLLPEVMAHNLLRELVVLEAVTVKVVEAERQLRGIIPAKAADVKARRSGSQPISA